MSDDQKLILERFGRYLILDHLVDGGMAKICRARFLGEQADKVVAIKMVQPQYSKDEAFKTMFMDEIKLTFGLIHPNIVQVYDYGYHTEQLFVAMEYCDGKNLKEYLEKLKERKFVFPVEISTYTISQACQGLYYAHTFRDKLTGEETNIIHRDISPHNIMLTYDGSVKVIDFGIAKSKGNSESTQAGTIKGKLSYLAPEYLEGFELDPRYDQFAVGITLWEMLCSRKLFKDNNDLAVLKKIQECKVPPPSSINPNVPKELDEIVLKALSKNRNNRYDNMDQFNRALMKFLYSKYPEFNATDLSYFAQELFKDNIKRDREKMFEFGKVDIKPYLEELKREATGADYKEPVRAKKTRDLDDDSPAPRAKEQVFDMGFEDQDTTSKLQKTKKMIGRKNAKDSDDDTLGDQKRDIRTSTVSRRTQRPVELNKTRSLKDRKDGTQSLLRKSSEKPERPSAVSSIIKGVAVLAVVLGGGGYFYMNHMKKVEPVVVEQSQNQVRKPSSNFGVTTTLSDKETTLIISQFSKQKHRIFLNDEQVTPDLIGAIKIPLNKKVTLRIEVLGRRHFIKELYLKDKKSETIEIPADLPPASYAYVVTSRSCVEGELSFTIFDEQRKEKLPMTDSLGIAFPLDYDAEGKVSPTTHTLDLMINGEDVTRKLEITLKREEETIDLCDQLGNNTN